MNLSDGSGVATPTSAPKAMKRVGVGAAVEKIEEKREQRPRIFSGTARGVAKQLQIPPSFFIQAAGLIYHHRMKCGVYHQKADCDLLFVSHHALACITLRLDDIQNFVLMICNSYGIHDIQGSALINLR